MKKNNFGSLMMILAAILFISVSCTKEGPAGVAGADGTNGTNGTDGTDGVDGNASCIQCHTIAKKDAVTAKYEMSTHHNSVVQYNGQYTYQYAGEGPSRVSCTGCHSEQGFVAWQYTGQLSYPDTNGVQTAMPIGCVSCHDMHNTLDFENDGIDYALRASGPVQLLMYTDGSVTIDMGGSSNLCVNCHQPRTAGPTDDGSGEFTITSSHYGPHHGPHATVLQGIGAYELDNGYAYPASGTSAHRTESSCTSCHMGKTEDGGHTFHVTLESCTGCHDDATDFDYNGVQTWTANKLETLKQKFIDNGMWDEEADHIVPGTYPIDHAGAYYNYVTVADDRSGGVHNPAYVQAILENSIAAFN